MTDLERAREIARARQILAPYFATDGEDEHAELVEELLVAIAAALAQARAEEREALELMVLRKRDLYPAATRAYFILDNLASDIRARSAAP